MANTLNISISQMRESIRILENAIAEFEPYSKEFIKNTEKSLEPMNSDFIDTMEDTLNNMRNTKAPKLLKKLNSYAEAATKVIEELEHVDTEMGQAVSETTRGGR